MVKIDLVKIFKLDNLDEEEKLKQSILIRIIVLTVFFGFIWGVIYFLLGYALPGLVPIIYGILSIGNMFQYYLYQRYSVFRLIQLILILLLPFCMQIALGGFINGSTVVLASILCPLGALMFHNMKTAVNLFYFFIGVVVLAGIYEGFNPESEIHMNKGLSITFFTSNLIVISSIIFALLTYFVGKKNHMQNLLVQKNKDITDSITYAKRIQEAILPPDRLVKQLLPESFILYKPKDIVSGDFYWTAQWGHDTMFAAVDCTGHGVPGAFLSIVGQNLLNQAVNEHGLSKPNLVLNSLNKGVSRTLGKDEEIKDGMDIALCSLNRRKMVVEFAGAYNPLWLLRNGEIIEIKGNKFPIGSFMGETHENFDNNEIPVQKGDLLYVFTDGYADQFGGPKGKKFKYKNIQKILLDHANESMERQKEILDTTIETWRGNFEQLDDILIIGVRV
jgi:serine phosphatase RsbU (regulator of sigma subunit)